MRLDYHETQVAGHDLDADDDLRTMQMLVYYVIAPGAIIGSLIILWSVYQIIKGLWL